jgi:hypothetical protein
MRWLSLFHNNYSTACQAWQIHQFPKNGMIMRWGLGVDIGLRYWPYFVWCVPKPSKIYIECHWSVTFLGSSKNVCGGRGMCLLKRFGPPTRGANQISLSFERPASSVIFILRPFADCFLLMLSCRLCSLRATASKNHNVISWYFELFSNGQHEPMLFLLKWWFFRDHLTTPKFGYQPMNPALQSGKAWL